MPQVHVPGASEATGRKAPDPLVKGWYLVECTEAGIYPNEAKKYDRITLKHTVLDGPDQNGETERQRDPQGRTFVHSMFILRPDHASYEKAGGPEQPAIQDFSELAKGPPVELKDDIDDELMQEFVTSQYWVNLGVKPNTIPAEKTDSGEEETRYENVLYKAKPAS